MDDTDIEWERDYVESSTSNTIAQIMSITGEGRSKTAYFVDRAIAIGDPAKRKRKVLEFCPAPADQGFFESPIEYERRRQDEGLRILANQFLPGRERMAEEARLEAKKRRKSVWLLPSPAFGLEENIARQVYDLINELRGDVGRLQSKIAARQR